MMLDQREEEDFLKRLLMKRRKQIQALIDISQRIGISKAYIQGGGGNTSVKLNKNLMAIKSSGTNLKDMSEEYGHCIVDFRMVNKFLNKNDVEENKFSEMINSFSKDEKNRPSIETGFHSLLGKFVIHTHSVFVNVLLCSKEGKKMIKQLFPDSIWIDYHTPGRNLTLALKEKLEKIKESSNEEIIVFLQNHGLIVSSSKHLRCLELHEKINDRIIDSFSLEDFKIYSSDKCIDKKILFPDQVVYLDKKDKTFSEAAIETASALSYILNQITKLHLTPNYLSLEDIKTLKNMESEKFRKSLVN